MCQLGTLDSASTVTATDIPEGCEASADPDEDQVYEEDLAKGDSDPADTQLKMFCELGVQDATGTVSLADAPAP